MKLRLHGSSSVRAPACVHVIVLFVRLAWLRSPSSRGPIHSAVLPAHSVLAAIFPAVRTRTPELFRAEILPREPRALRLRSHTDAFCHFTTFADEIAPEIDPASPLLLYFWNIINAEAIALPSAASSGSLEADLWPSTTTAEGLPPPPPPPSTSSLSNVLPSKAIMSRGEEE